MRSFSICFFLKKFEQLDKKRIILRRKRKRNPQNVQSTEYPDPDIVMEGPYADIDFEGRSTYGRVEKYVFCFVKMVFYIC